MKRDVIKTIEKTKGTITGRYDMSIDDVYKIMEYNNVDRNNADAINVIYDAFVYGFEMGKRSVK